MYASRHKGKGSSAGLAGSTASEQAHPGGHRLLNQRARRPGGEFAGAGPQAAAPAAAAAARRLPVEIQNTVLKARSS